MARFYRKKLLLSKLESTSAYGVDTVPVGTTNAILTRDLTIEVMQGDTVQRNSDRPTLGGELTYHVAPHTRMSFMVEAAAAGTAGDAPAYGPLLRACGLGETISAGTDVTYAPVSSGFESVSSYFSMDGIRHISLGQRGTVRLTLGPGSIPYFNFQMTGLRTAPTDTADPTPDFTDFQTPLPVTDSNTPTFTLDGYAANLYELELDLSNNVIYRNIVGQESVEITDRGVTGTLTIEEPLLATKNFHAICAAHTTVAMQYIHGTAAGGIIQIDCPHVQLLQPTIGERDGVATLSFQLSVIPSASGNDEVTIKVK